MEPVNPTFKDDYRRIALDERTWLHIEVTQYGLATNIHLIAQSEMWQDKLHKGLMRWDHDKGIVENVMDIFDVSDMSQVGKHMAEESKPLTEEEVTCGICFCAELVDTPGVPQPLCQNPNCGVSFHKFCLYQWLVACEGGRPPAFGVANGNCPTCLHPIACSEKDS
ncbi:E3 ubiquitin-protein ligase FANCL isoform X2 [Aricia agestis]|nr:E3 ubiquitin-protein ligase FANCL isoform X2 [Aricia agestis]XP_041986757.1 E3 ubiquitin-protein ligase FANCL isoform X2 [Aricia agestis]